MVRERPDKGKAKVEESAKKKRKTREEREAEAAERVADAFDAMQSGRAGSLRIGATRPVLHRAAKPKSIPVDPQPPKGYKSRTKYPTPKKQPAGRYSSRTTSAAEIVAQQEARERKKAKLAPEPEVESDTPDIATGFDSGEEEEIQLPVHPTDPVLTGDAELVSYQGYSGERLKKIRYMITPGRWFPEQRDTRVDRRFWTLVQASLYQSYRAAHFDMFPHAVLSLPRIGTVLGENVYPYFHHLPGLVDLLEHQYRYSEEWARVFYATLFVEEGRHYIQFMFSGVRVRLSRQQIADMLGLTLFDRRLHFDVYGDAEPPRRSKVGGEPSTAGGGSCDLP
jgi:hypothetical protein